MGSRPRFEDSPRIGRTGRGACGDGRSAVGTGVWRRLTERSVAAPGQPTLPAVDVHRRRLQGLSHGRCLGAPGSARVHLNRVLLVDSGIFMFLNLRRDPAVQSSCKVTRQNNNSSLPGTGPSSKPFVCTDPFKHHHTSGRLLVSHFPDKRNKGRSPTGRRWRSRT